MIFIGIFMGIFLLDLLAKRYAEYRLKEKESRQLAGGAVILHRLENPGTALGFLSGHGKAVLRGTFLVLTVLSVYFLHLIRRPGRTGEKLGLALLLGGGWNNWADRAVKGSVTDYISFRSRWRRIRRIVFNLSDFAIFAGSVLAALCHDRRRS